jgi:hypothetical protein
MARKTIRVSDHSGAEIQDGKAQPSESRSLMHERASGNWP